jgi:precorrin-6B methylase 2
LTFYTFLATLLPGEPIRIREDFDVNTVNPKTLLGLARNFIESRIMLTGAEMDLFTLLTPAPLSIREIAEKKQADPRGLAVLLDALAAMGFLVKEAEKYQCPASISRFLSGDAPESVLPMLQHMAGLWTRWSKLTDVVRGRDVESMKPIATSRDEHDMRAFIGAMHVVAKSLAPQVVAAIDPGPCKALLDVGGALGTYTMAFLQAVPDMKATLFDRPEVIELSRKQLDDAGFLGRVTLVPGDFYADELPGGHDLALLSAIIHQNGPDQNVELFSKVFRALIPGGRIVVRDHIMAADRTSPKAGAIFAVNMLMVTPAGGTYTFDEVRKALTQAGFVRVRLLQTGEHMDGLVEAFKPD